MGIIFLKATRKICGAVKSGVREFTETGFKIETGTHPFFLYNYCQAQPKPQQNYSVFVF